MDELKNDELKSHYIAQVDAYAKARTSGEPVPAYFGLRCATMAMYGDIAAENIAGAEFLNKPMGGRSKHESGCGMKLTGKS